MFLIRRALIGGDNDFLAADSIDFMHGQLFEFENVFRRKKCALGKLGEDVWK